MQVVILTGIVAGFVHVVSGADHLIAMAPTAINNPQKALKNRNLIKRINSVNQNNIEVIGDNIEFSEDSKKFGLINNEKIIGIVTSKLIIPKLRNFLIQKNRSTSLNPK